VYLSGVAAITFIDVHISRDLSIQFILPLEWLDRIPDVQNSLHIHLWRRGCQQILGYGWKLVEDCLLLLPKWNGDIGVYISDTESEYLNQW